MIKLESKAGKIIWVNPNLITHVSFGIGTDSSCCVNFLEKGSLWITEEAGEKLIKEINK